MDRETEMGRIRQERLDKLAKIGDWARAAAEEAKAGRVPNREVVLDMYRQDLLKEAAFEIDPLVNRAQVAWDQGLRFLSLVFPDEQRPVGMRKPMPEFEDEFGNTGEKNWDFALERILNVGWRLHTWTVVVRNDHLIPVPLFERPSS